jgi:DNA-binding PadR family transcriptional regulator
LRIYRLTKSGRKQLVVERSRWAQLTEAIEGILNPAKQENES